MLEMMMFAMLSLILIRKVLILANQIQTKAINRANISHLVLIGCDVVMVTINFVTMALKFMPVLTLTLDEFNGVMQVIAIIELLVFYVTLLQPLQNIADVLLFFDQIEAKKFYYWRMPTTAYVLDKKAKGTCPVNENSLRLRKCYMFGTSTANIRIESTWMRMIRSQTKPWLVSFEL